MAVRREFIEDLYRNTLNRGDNFTSGEVEGWMNAPDEESVRNMFLGSPEYTSQHGGNATWQDVGGQIQTIGDSAPPPVIGPSAGDYRPYDVTQSTNNKATGVNNSPYTGFTPRYDYSAFNTQRLQDPGKSAKDAFAMISNNAPPPPFQDKQAMAQWFNQNIRPSMDALGHQVLSVSEDGFTYTNPEGTFFVDFGQNSGAAPGTALQRLQWNATPADAQTAARYASTGSGAATSGTTRTNAGSNLQSLGQAYGGPGGAGITNGPLQQVGQDPLSYLITGGLADFLERGGQSGFGSDVEDMLRGYLTGEGPVNQGVDEGRIAKRFESARELLDKGRRTMVNDARGDLANRNLLSEPGIPQGAESGTLARISENIAPEFSRALRDIYTDESAKADARTLSALQLAAGVSSDQARNFLAGIGEGTARQSALSDIALRTLQTNMAWSQFLAQFGLQRDQVMYEMQNGNIEQMLPLLQAFIQLGGLANAGYT